MQIVRNAAAPPLIKTGAWLLTVGLMACSSLSVRAGGDASSQIASSMKINAGTAFNLSPVFDEQGNPVFPWLHEVRGIVQVSNLGNATGHFHVRINSGADCEGGHTYCLSGTMRITTLAGDQLDADVVGWGDPDPNDPTGAMNLLHYDVTVTGGSGRLQNAHGSGEINGAFFFCGADCFCDSYAGVATWTYDGVLLIPRKSQK